VGISMELGWRPGLQEDVQDARKRQARQRGHRKHQEARLKVLPGEDMARPHRTVPALDKGAPFRQVLVVPVPCANERLPVQGLSEMEAAAEDSVGGGAEGDGEGEEPLDDPGSAGRWEIWAGGARLPLLNGRMKASSTVGRERHWK